MLRSLTVYSAPHTAMHWWEENNLREKDKFPKNLPYVNEAGGINLPYYNWTLLSVEWWVGTSRSGGEVRPSLSLGHQRSWSPGAVLVREITPFSHKPHTTLTICTKIRVSFCHRLSLKNKPMWDWGDVMRTSEAQNLLFLTTGTDSIKQMDKLLFMGSALSFKL